MDLGNDAGMHSIAHALDAAAGESGE
jgi:hypothetical protein